MRMSLAALRRLGLRVAAATPSRAAAPGSRRREGPTPHDLLWTAVAARYRSAVREYAGAVPGRRFRVDIAIVARRVAVEVDGYRHHGRFKADFQRDRTRQNLLVLHGWRVLRFTAADIRGDLVGVLGTLRTACAAPTTRRTPC